MYSETPWLGRNSSLDRPTTAITRAERNSSGMLAIGLLHFGPLLFRKLGADRGFPFRFEFRGSLGRVFRFGLGRKNLLHWSRCRRFRDRLRFWRSHGPGH